MAGGNPGTTRGESCATLLLDGVDSTVSVGGASTSCRLGPFRVAVVTTRLTQIESAVTRLLQMSRPTSLTENRRDASEIVRVDVTQQVYEAIRSRLLTREFRGAEKVNLQSFADELGVSRTPVSNALLRLTAEGLLVSVPTGYVVRPLTEDLLDGLHETRLALELHAATLSVGRTTEYQLNELEQLGARTVAAANAGDSDARAFAASNGAFHQYQVALAGHTTMSEAYDRLWVFHLQERAFLLFDEMPSQSALEEHHAILDAYRQADLEAALAAIRADAENERLLCREALVRGGGWL
jgi:DNA-binding GntR family transcriptional regulator